MVGTPGLLNRHISRIREDSTNGSKKKKKKKKGKKEEKNHLKKAKIHYC